MIGRVLGYPVEIVIPENASLERKKRLLAHGAQLIFTSAQTEAATGRSSSSVPNSTPCGSAV